jgi:hypothetical protein
MGAFNIKNLQKPLCIGCNVLLKNWYQNSMQTHKQLNLKLLKCVDIKKLQAKGQIKSFKDMNIVLCTSIICEFFFCMFKGKNFKASLPTSNAYFSIALKYYNRL